MMRNIKAPNNTGGIIIYQTPDKKVELDVKLGQNTVWLTQRQISDLFLTERSVITKHLRNIFDSKELNRASACAVFARTARDGKVYQTEYYGLDAIISVGYRVNSKRATQFRIWATKVLKDHIVKGYALNYKRISELETKPLAELDNVVSLIRRTIERRSLSSGEESGLLKVITEYAHSWILLHQYDTGQLSVSVQTRAEKYKLEYYDAKKAIEELKINLTAKKEASNLFGQERAGGLDQITGGIYQSFGGRALYRSIEEKAANLFYFIIKDHPFADGNKRIASFLLIVFLARNNYLFKKNGERKINDNALVALALLIAESEPKQKDIMIKLVINLLVK